MPSLTCWYFSNDDNKYYLFLLYSTGNVPGTVLINESIFTTAPRRQGPLLSPNYRRGNLGNGGNVTAPVSLPSTGSQESGDLGSE